MEAKEIEVGRNQRGEFRFVVHSKNNKIIDDSEEGYEHLQFAIKKAQERWPGVPVHVKYTAYEDREEPEQVDYMIDPVEGDTSDTGTGQ